MGYNFRVNMNKTLDYISQELVRVLKTVQPTVKNQYNQVTITTQSKEVVIPKQANSARSSSGSRSV